MSTGTSPPGMPAFNMAQFPSDSDRSAAARTLFARSTSSDDGHATVNLPQSSAGPGHDAASGIGQGASAVGAGNMGPSSQNGGAQLPGAPNAPFSGRSAYDQASRLRHNFNARSSSPLSRPPLFSPNLLHEVERSSFPLRSPSGSHPASSPPPRSNVTSPRYFNDPSHGTSNSHQHHPHLQQNPHLASSHTQQQPFPQQSQHQHLHPHPSQPASHQQASNSPNPYSPATSAPLHGQPQPSWQQPRSGMTGPLDYPPSLQSSSPLNPVDRPHSSMSERTSRMQEAAARGMGPGTAQSPVGSLHKDSEYSIFVGDLSPDLREEDLVAQFLQPPSWPPGHPFASALINAQQAQGIYQPGAHIGPAPFHSTKSAKIMSDPATGISKGYGFVRFALEADCNRALVEMQGVVVSPANGLSPGRPLRVSTATPKNRANAPSLPQGLSGDPNTQHLQMPRPHNPAQNAGASFLYGGGAPGAGGLGARGDVVSPQPHSRQQSSPPDAGSLTSPISPTSPYDGTNASSSTQGMMGPSFGQLYGAFPNAGDSTRDSSPAGMLRSHTPSSAPPMPHQGGPGGPGGNAGDSAADPNNTTVFVGGLSSLISETTLRRYFEHFGEITYVKIPPGKGCGFVQYVRKQDAENAIQRMNGFPILNSKIRLSWGRSQGDKAAAAAAQTMAQYAQLGQLAGLAGLSTLSPSQLAQLAGLGSALSAAQAQAQRGPAYGASNPPLANDPLSTLARQLAAANLNFGPGVGAPAPGNPNMAGLGPRGHLPPFLQHPQQSSAHDQHHQPGLPQHPPSQQFRGPAGFGSTPNVSSPGAGPNGAAFGGSASSHSNHGFDFDPRAGPGAGGFGSAPQDAQRGRPPFASHGLDDGALSEAELADAFAGLDFDEGTRAALAARLQAAQGAQGRSHANGFEAGSNANPSGRADPFARGFNRDPNAFMFSPFSPSDSPVVGGKADLPHAKNASPSLHLSPHRHDENGSAAKDATAPSANR